MTKTASLFVSAVMVMALATPPLAAAQAGRRGGSAGGDSGGSAGGRTSSEPSVGTAQPRSAPSQPESRPPSVERSSSSAGSTGGPRVTSRANGVRPEGTSTVTRGQGGADRLAAAGRARGAQASRGVAQARSTFDRPGGGSAPIYYYPRYGDSRYGYYGYYNPWYFGASYWGWSRYGYGAWHSPYLYDPYSYYGGPWPYYWGSSVYAEDDDRVEDRETEPMGALRLRMNPRTAKVYVDGALAGIVDEFDGLSNHLRLPAGRHQVEFRADGYETLSVNLTVEAGKTRTERGSLRKR